MVIVFTPDEGLVDTIDAVGMIMEAVVAELMPHVEIDKRGAHHTNREAEDIDGGEQLLAAEVAKEEAEVVDHGSGLGGELQSPGQ